MLQAAIESLRAQNYADIEIIVIDNDSSDDSVAWCKEQSDVRSIENSKNLGASITRNQGARIATGDYLLFMDSDAEIRSEGGLQRLVNHLEEDRNIAGISGIYYTDNELTKLWNWSPVMDWEGSYDEPASMVAKEEIPTLSTCLQLVRADLFREIGGFDEYFFYLYDDADLSDRLRKLGHRLAVDPEVKVWHHFSDEGRIQRDHLAHHYYYEDLRLRFVMKNYGLGCFLRSCWMRLRNPRRWLKLYVYMNTRQLYDIYLIKAFRHILHYPEIRASRTAKWL